MSASEATVKALRELGLTEYETAAYLSLVEGGQISASDVSSRSKVPYSRIYDVLGRLEEKGFIQVQRGRPTIYIAKAPTEVARLVRMAWEDKIETASSIVVNELQPRFEREVQASSRDVWLMHGRAAILAKALEMLESARDEVKLSVPSLDMGMEDLTAIVERVLHVKCFGENCGPPMHKPNISRRCLHLAFKSRLKLVHDYATGGFNLVLPCHSHQSCNFSWRLSNVYCRPSSLNLNESFFF